MKIRFEDITSLTDFAKNTKAHLKKLKRAGRPELLTVNGKAEAVVQNASAYQLLLEKRETHRRDHRGESVAAQPAVVAPNGPRTWCAPCTSNVRR